MRKIVIVLAVMLSTAVVLVSVASSGTSTTVTTAQKSKDKNASSPNVVARSSRSETYCPQVKKGINWYRGKIVEYRQQRSLAAPQFSERPRLCSRAKEVAAIARERAAAEREAYKRWHDYHWNWQIWLPDKWQRIGACETGYGQRPGNWRHANSKFQGAFGFYYGSWDAFVPRADPKAGPYPAEAWQATPRQQYEVAMAIYRMYGLSGWGCRGA